MNLSYIREFAQFLVDENKHNIVLDAVHISNNILNVLTSRFGIDDFNYNDAENKRMYNYLSKCFVQDDKYNQESLSMISVAIYEILHKKRGRKPLGDSEKKVDFRFYIQKKFVEGREEEIKAKIIEMLENGEL